MSASAKPYREAARRLRRSVIAAGPIGIVSLSLQLGFGLGLDRDCLAEPLEGGSDHGLELLGDNGRQAAEHVPGAIDRNYLWRHCLSTSFSAS